MRAVINTTKPENLDIKELKEYVDSKFIVKGTIGTVFSYSTVDDFPTVGKEDCLYIAKDDRHQVYTYNNDNSEYEPINDYDIIQG
jgi:hypothetical protein